MEFYLESLPGQMIAVFFRRPLNSCLHRVDKEIKVAERIYSMLCEPNFKSYIRSIDRGTLNTNQMNLVDRKSLTSD